MVANKSKSVNSLERCYQAFERLKVGAAENTKFVGIAPEQVTASIVSQEAGFDPGYLKKKRPNHQALLHLIKNYAQENTSRSTLSKAEIVRRERQKLEKCKEELRMVSALLNESLAREILLASRLSELEKIAFKSANIAPIDR